MKLAITTVAAAFFSAQALFASALSQVTLAPIQHVDASVVVVGTDGGEKAYTPADLETLPTYAMTTTTPWREVPAEYVGILLSDLLEANGLASVDSIVVTAENDYQTVIARELWESVDILVATRVDGRAHTRRDRGPIQFIIDSEAFKASPLTTESDLVWMVARIEANR